MRMLDIFSELFLYEQIELQRGLKYLGFYLKPKNYDKQDWG